MSEDDALPRGLNLDEPRWDQNTYGGRLKYFFVTTNPLNVLKSRAELQEVRDVVLKYKYGQPLPGLTLADVYKAKDVYDSAFHRETGEKMTLIGRMSAQVPANMMITGCMLAFYKSTPAVIFWQWFNQSFNAMVNYTNRSGPSPMPLEQIATSYVFATSGALCTALTLNKFAAKAPPVVGRLVPFAAVAAANCINIPLMRYRELKHGIPVVTDGGEELGKSRLAAKTGIEAVVVSRVAMAAPGMVLTPFVMEYLERKGLSKKCPKCCAPLQILLSGFFLTFATPMCCALFPQTSPISVSELEPHLREKASEMRPVPKFAYYNKGL